MKLLAYTIGGQTIGIDITTWSASMLSGNTAFMAIADTGSTPTDYVDISSTFYWDNFGGGTTLTAPEIKTEIVKLIPDVPTAQEYAILEGYMNVGINSIIKNDYDYTLATSGTSAVLSGITDNKLDLTGSTDTTLRVWEVTGSTGKFEDVLRINGKFYAEWIKNLRTASRAAVLRYDDTDPLVNGNIGGIVVLNPSGGTPFTGGSATEYWIGVDSSGITRSGWADEEFKALLNGAANIGAGEGLASGVTGSELQLKSLVEGSNITLTSDANSITIDAAGGTGGTITTLSTTNGGGTTTTSATDVLMTGMQLTSVPAGDYFLSFGTTFNHSQNGASITTSIYVGGTQVTNSSQQWMRGNAQGNVTTTHNYAGFPITVATTGNVEIYWQTDNATATSANRYMSLIKV